MKKFLGISLIVSAIILQAGIVFAASNKQSAPSSFLYQAIGKYKSGNFIGCVQDMDYLIDKGQDSDLAYYYQALSYARLGIKDKAKEAYQKAASKSTNITIIQYSKEAVKCIDNPSSCSSTDTKNIGNFIKSKRFLHEDVENELRQKAVEEIKTKINKDEPPTYEDMKYINYQERINQDSSTPTDKEIADAVRTFQKLGINPLNAQGYNGMMYQDPSMMQLSAFLGNNNNNNNNMMNLLPYLTSTQGSDANRADMNKNMIQAMMLNQMLPNLSFGSNDK